MGIQGVGRVLAQCEGGVTNVSIPDIAEKDGRNVVVVDGSHFYGVYLYPKFDWVCGGLRGLVDEVRRFVSAFERAGLKLVFFFVDGHLDEGADSCGSEKWTKRHSEFVEYSKNFLRYISRPDCVLSRPKKDRHYYHAPLHVLSVIIFALKDILKCEVHMTHSGQREDRISYYSRDENCLAVLAEDNFYLFYRGVSRYLSLKRLDIGSMTTCQYHPSALDAHFNLRGQVYPFLVKLALDPDYENSGKLETLVELALQEFDCHDKEQVLRNIRKRMEEEVRAQEAAESGEDSDESEDTADELDVSRIPLSLYNDFLRYNTGFKFVSSYGPFKPWALIVTVAQELYESGKMSNKFNYMLATKFYNDCILEDFSELPPSSFVYQPLRRKLYGVLFNTILKAKNLPEGFAVKEWCMSRNGCPNSPVSVTPEPVDPALHPGLLTLWNLRSVSDELLEKKWRLFANCVSEHLDHSLLRALPPTLVLPAAVLFYLHREMPPAFRSEPWKFMEQWEVEAFIAEAVMLPRSRPESFSSVPDRSINTRVVKLIAAFVYGCQMMRLVVEVCGFPVPQDALCLLHFFDGWLFHALYEKAAWRRSAAHLCDRESTGVFQQMKQIVLGGSASGGNRTLH